MRTTDFSRAPLIGQATAEFVGATKFRGPISMIKLARRWYPMLAKLKRSPGYRGHHVWYRFPFTLGTIAFFADTDALLSFARSPEHHAILFDPRFTIAGVGHAVSTDGIHYYTIIVVQP